MLFFCHTPHFQTYTEIEAPIGHLLFRILDKSLVTNCPIIWLLQLYHWKRKLTVTNEQCTIRGNRNCCFFCTRVTTQLKLTHWCRHTVIISESDIAVWCVNKTISGWAKKRNYKCRHFRTFWAIKGVFFVFRCDWRPARILFCLYNYFVIFVGQIDGAA